MALLGNFAVQLTKPILLQSCPTRMHRLQMFIQPKRIRFAGTQIQISPTIPQKDNIRLESVQLDAGSKISAATAGPEAVNNSTRKPCTIATNGKSGAKIEYHRAKPPLAKRAPQTIPHVPRAAPI